MSSATGDPWLPMATTIVSVEREVPGVATFSLAFDEPERRAAYRFRPGQFNMLYLPGIGEAAISISSGPDEPQPVRHTVRFVGSVTNALARQPVGASVLLRGPFGSAWPLDECRGCDVIVAAGGLGLAPLRPVLEFAARRRDEFGRLVLLYGARTPELLLFASEFANWRAAGWEVEPTVDLANDAWRGAIGVVPSLLARLRLDPPRTRVLTCGPEVMMRFVVREAFARGVGPEQVWMSLERNMNCAVGFCGHCQFGPTFVCRDGPVFRYDRLAPFLHVEDF